MLVLSRKLDESVVLVAGGVEHRVTVVDIRGDKVRLGIQSPPEFAVHRSEVWDAIQRDSGPALGSSGASKDG